jgi:hypothetical protein
MTARTLLALCASALFLLIPRTGAGALEPWLNPELAGRHAVFVDVALSPIVFADLSLPGLPLEIRIDYLLPVGLPFSAGLFMKTPYPNLKSFGLRLAYHVDVRDAKTDLYGAYVFDVGFVRNGILGKYEDTPTPLHYFDFRVGVRRAFGPWFCLGAETGFKFQSILLFVSIKLH